MCNGGFLEPFSRRLKEFQFAIDKGDFYGVAMRHFKSASRDFRFFFLEGYQEFKSVQGFLKRSFFGCFRSLDSLKRL